MVNLVTGTELKVIPVTPAKLDPVTATRLPTVAEVGLTPEEEIVGAEAGV